GERFTVVADAATYDALGERVARELKTLGPVDVLILDHPHADMANVESLAVKLADADAVVAVGSGTINDLCK
ncbi:MAG: sn-glycerol-1-phosphate dehydrogenase, partial [Mesorhizobium sp.]